MPVATAAEILSCSPRPLLIEALSGADARARFEAEHIAGARLLGLDADLAAIGPDPRDGGRHPLPSPAAFAKVLEREGVAPGAPVAVYDDKDGGNAAARLYVMLRAMGHRDVTLVASGKAGLSGKQALKDAGAAVAVGPSAPAKVTTYPAPDRWGIPLISIDEVELAIREGHAVVLDARARDRFEGRIEPFDPVPGHVPGARNLPYAELFADGALRSADDLRARFEMVGATERPVIMQCGSGVTACMLMIAMEEAGLAEIGPDGPALWVGSYSEWSRRGKPIATGPAADDR